MTRDELIAELQRYHPDSPEAAAIMAQITAAPQTAGSEITAPQPLPTQQFATRGAAGGIDFDALLRDFPERPSMPPPAPRQAPQAAPQAQPAPRQAPAAPQASGTRIYTVQAPNGETIKVEGPDGASDEEVLRQAQALYASQPSAPQPAQPPAPAQPRTWGAVPAEAISNIIPSGAKLATGIYETLASPVETLRNTGDLAAGSVRAGLRKVLPASLEAAGNEDTQRQDAMARAAWEALKKRYGSEEGWKRTLATDPVGALADVSTVLTGGSALAPKSALLAKAATLTDPLALAGKGLVGTVNLGNKATRNVVGALTGVGGDALHGAWEAGRQGGEIGQVFRDTMRGKKEFSDVVADARTGLENIREKRSQAYADNLAQATNSQVSMDFVPILRDTDKIVSSVSHKGFSTVSPAEMAVIQGARKVVEDWSKAPELHNPAGVNALRQRISAVIPEMGMNQARRVLTEINDSLRSKIEKVEPQYKKMNDEYSASKALSDELERTLSLGRRASKDTTLRRLLSSTRSGVQANFGERLNAVRRLEQEGNVHLLPALAGANLSSFMPSGLAGTLGAGSVLAAGAGLHPAPLLMALQSPRAVGEVAHLGGRIAGKVSPFAGEISRRVPRVTPLANIDLLAGRAAQEVQRNQDGTVDLLASGRDYGKRQRLDALSELEAERKRREQSN